MKKLISIIFILSSLTLVAQTSKKADVSDYFNRAAKLYAYKQDVQALKVIEQGLTIDPENEPLQKLANLILKNKQKQNQDKNKNQQNQDKQNKDNKDNKDKKDQNKDKQDDKNKQEKKEKQQQMSKEDAERILKALNNDEKKVQEKLKKENMKKKSKTDKDW